MHGDSITLSASDEYGFDPRSPENFRFDWILDGKIVSTTKRSFTFTPKKSGNYKFIVSAQDRNGNVAFDYVIVTVGD